MGEVAQVQMDVRDRDKIKGILRWRVELFCSSNTDLRVIVESNGVPAFALPISWQVQHDGPRGHG